MSNVLVLKQYTEDKPSSKPKIVIYDNISYDVYQIDNIDKYIKLPHDILGYKTLTGDEPISQPVSEPEESEPVSEPVSEPEESEPEDSEPVSEPEEEEQKLIIQSKQNKPKENKPHENKPKNEPKKSKQEEGEEEENKPKKIKPLKEEAKIKPPLPKSSPPPLSKKVKGGRVRRTSKTTWKKRK